MVCNFVTMSVSYLVSSDTFNIKISKRKKNALADFDTSTVCGIKVFVIFIFLLSNN